MDLFTLPSWREGMPRSIIEAMMMSLPVVATDIRGSREEVVNNETGLLVPLRNPKALAQAIEFLYKDREKTKKMGKAGRKRALKLYNEKNVIKKQLAIINTFAIKDDQ
jgi:glycosyltransferase involved in cell wall biosynthesis